ncbi:MAG: hypothetical protein ACXV8K_10430 [Ilumatobacteraceae bacterium]
MFLHQNRLVREAMLSRRSLLAAGTGLGVAGLATGLMGAAPAAAAHSSDAGSGAPAVTGFGPFGASTHEDPATGAPPATNIATPTPVAGATIRTIVAEAFVPAALGSGSSLVGILSSPNGAYNSAGGALFAPLDIPTGGILKQVDCYGAGVGGTWFVLAYDNVGNSTTVASTAATAGPGLVQKTFSGLNVTVGPGSQILADLAATSANYYAVAVSYQYIPATPGFHPIAPARVYDSRFNAPIGIVPAGGSRLISVANAYNPGTNVISHVDVVPAGAVAIAYNLTVTDTPAAGYLQLAPGSSTVVTGSSINWAAGQTVANGGTVTLDASRQVKALPVASSCNVIVDVQGYYL